MDRRQKIDLLKITARMVEGYWLVPSYSNPAKKYKVVWNGTGGTCECKGFEFRKWCVHLDVVKEIAPRVIKEVFILDEY